ncbi:Ankyrin repeat-containing domain [Globisporangium polare]
MKNLVRRMFGKDALHLKLRRAVETRKPRQIAELLEQGASPVFRSAQDKPQQLNALLLGCQQGDAHIVNLLLDWFFHQRALLAHWGPQMYCMVIRSGHWKAFLRLHQRNVPQHVQDPEASAKIPEPIFIAAESGQHQILSFLMSQGAPEWRSYEFGGHSLLSIASRHGHYECVEVLLANMMPTFGVMDFAVDCARKHRQAHVLVLLTSCLPEYNSNLSQVHKPPYNLSSGNQSSQGSSRCTLLDDVAMLQRQRGHHRGSLAETEVMSEYDENDLERRSSAWGLQRYSDERDSLPSSDYGMPFSNDSDEAAYQRYNPNRQTMDGYALLEAAREADARKKERRASAGEFENRQRSSGELTWNSSSSSQPVSSEDDEERWYAMKPTDSSELIHPYIKSNTSSCSSSSTDPFTDFDGTFHAAAEEQVASWRFTKKRQPLQPKSNPKRERELVIASPPPPILQSMPMPMPMQPLPPISGSTVHIPTPPVSNKLINIRSSNFRSCRTLPSIREERSPAIGQD